jgi:hypothetical protein
VVATIEKPNSHHGILRPDKKYSDALLHDLFETIIPISKVVKKKNIMIE